MIKNAVFNMVEWVVLHMAHYESFGCDQVLTTGRLNLWVTYEPMTFIGSYVVASGAC